MGKSGLFSESSGLKTQNCELMGTHRNIFFSEKRLDVKTATQILIDTLKEQLTEGARVSPQQ